MIARIWRGLTREADKDTYFQYLQKTGLKDYARIKGNRGVWVLRRVHGGRAEFVLMSLWDSYDAIQAFAGPQYENAVYYPEDKRFLLELEPQVAHYQILTSPRAEWVWRFFPGSWCCRSDVVAVPGSAAWPGALELRPRMASP